MSWEEDQARVSSELREGGFSCPTGERGQGRGRAAEPGSCPVTGVGDPGSGLCLCGILEKAIDVVSAFLTIMGAGGEGGKWWLLLLLLFKLSFKMTGFYS